MYKLYLFDFDDDRADFVVISELPKEEVLQEWTNDHVSISRIVDVDSDLTSFPCDRALRHGF